MSLTNIKRVEEWRCWVPTLVVVLSTISTRWWVWELAKAAPMDTNPSWAQSYFSRFFKRKTLKFSFPLQSEFNLTNYNSTSKIFILARTCIFAILSVYPRSRIPEIMCIGGIGRDGPGAPHSPQYNSARESAITTTSAFLLALR